MEKVKLSATNDMTGPGIPRMVITVLFTQDKSTAPFHSQKIPKSQNPKPPNSFHPPKATPKRLSPPKTPFHPQKNPQKPENQN
jgi:hypothetical protein